MPVALLVMDFQMAAVARFDGAADTVATARTVIDAARRQGVSSSVDEW